MIDSVTFGAQAADQNEGRVIDGGSCIATMDPSPGTSNPVTNTVPVLDAIADAWFYSGETIPGHDYSLFYNDTLLETQWYPLGDTEHGDGTPLEWEVPITNAPRRFYRFSIK